MIFPYSYREREMAIMGRTSLNIRPKVMIVITLITIVSIALICFAVLYFKAFFLISDMDRIIFYDNTTLNVNGLRYEYHPDKLFLKDTPERGKLFLENGSAYDVRCVFYNNDLFAVMVDGQYGYYLIHV